MIAISTAIYPFIYISIVGRCNVGGSGGGHIGGGGSIKPCFKSSNFIGLWNIWNNIARAIGGQFCSNSHSSGGTVYQGTVGGNRLGTARGGEAGG